jgi:hypothetical protein
VNIGELYIKLTADPSGVNRGVDQAERKFSGLAGTAMKLGAAVGGAMATKKVLDFGMASIRTFGEADAIWNRLAGTLHVAGVAFSEVEGDIRGAAAEMQRLTTVGDEDFATTLQTLVRISGDYAGSLQHVQTVADVAAGAQISLDAASQLVGKAMVGNTAALARYGIVVEEGADAMALLQDRFAGMAQNEANTLQGKTMQLSNAWGDFKEAIGGALVAAAGGGDIIGQVTLGIQAMTAWIERNSDTLRTMATVLGFVGEVIVRMVGNAMEALGMLFGMFDRLKGAVDTVTGAFRSMYDKVVGNSYVPDMVDGIEREFARLQAVMVDPAVRAANQVNAAFAGIKGPGGASGGLGGLFSAGGMLASLNPMTMITGMAVGMAASAMRGLFQKGFDSLLGRNKPKGAAAPTVPQTQVGSSSSNVPGGFDLAAARRQAGGASGLTVHIHNPPAGMDVVAVARQVKRAIAEDRRRGGISEFDIALTPAF